MLDLFFTYLVGKWLGNRQIRCNWASKTSGSNEEKQINENQNAVVLANGSTGRKFFCLIGPHSVGLVN